MADGANGTVEVPTPEEPISKLQKTLGLLFTPVGVIALFCEILGVSAQNTASISLAAVTLTGICLFRRRINKVVPSSLVLALLITLGATFTINYEHILFKDTGLVRYYHSSNDFLGSDGPFLDKARAEIWFVGMDFHITAGDRRDVILKKLGQGVKIRFLVFDPSSQFLDEIARDFDQDPVSLRSECSDSLSSLVSLQGQWTQSEAFAHYPDALQVRLFTDVPHARFYLVDPDDVKAQSYYVPYMNKENSPLVPGFLMRNIKSGVIEEYLPGIRKLWAASTPIGEYLQRHPEIVVATQR